MPLYHIIVLAVIQGITEFLPISSSGHLVLTHALFGNEVSDLCWKTNRLMDVAVHVGTLLSVLLYFRKDIAMMLAGVFKPQSNGFKLSGKIIIASLPVIVAGFALQMIQPTFLCLIQIMAWMSIIFGILLYFADKIDDGKTIEHLTLKHSFLIGLSQILALIPGVSRSGITMTSARFLGFSRIAAARFSLLLSIIAISGAGFLTCFDLIEINNINLGFDVLIAVALSFISGYIAISLMMKWLSRATFMPFVIYRLVLGVALLGLIYGGVI